MRLDKEKSFRIHKIHGKRKSNRSCNRKKWVMKSKNVCDDAEDCLCCGAKDLVDVGGK